MNSTVLLNVENHVATVTLNTPEQLNAMDEKMGEDFTRALNDIRADKNIRVVILTGAGRAFSAGGNLEMLREKFVRPPEQNQADLKKFYQTFLAIRDLSVPVIAAINGPAVGAGFCLSLACDLRYAAASAKLGANFAKLGLAPGMGGTYLITRLAGPVRAAEILLTGKIFDAPTLEKYGLINQTFDDATLMSEVKKIATDLASSGPVAVAAIKKGIQKALGATLEEMFDYDSSAQAYCFTTSDIQEGVKAVMEKRKPEFRGM